MDLPLVIHPIGVHGDRPALVSVDPAKPCQLIKEERKTVVWQQTLPDGTLAVLKLVPASATPHGCNAGVGSVGAPSANSTPLRLMESRGIACSPPLFWAAGTNRDDRPV
jgi:hypothetical protein